MPRRDTAGHKARLPLTCEKPYRNNFLQSSRGQPAERDFYRLLMKPREDSDPEQASLAFICKRLKLNYRKLSAEEREVAEKKIAEKSDLLKNPTPQRGDEVK